MDKVYEISLLMDFYGNMLTPRQYEVLDLHYNNDLSLAEIAEQLDISRQGVHDNIRRGKASLDDLEKRLGLVERFLRLKELAQEMHTCLQRIDKQNLSEKDKNNFDIIEQGTLKIIDEF